MAGQTKFIRRRNPDGTITEEEVVEKPQGGGIASIAPGYMVNDAIKQGMGGKGIFDVFSSGGGPASGQPVATATDGSGVLLGDSFGGASTVGGVPASGGGMFSLSGIGGAGNAILPAAGLAGMYDLYKNKPEEIGHGKGYLQGAASGAAMGSYFGPIGAVVGGGIGLGLNAFGIGGKSATKIEEKARKKLAEQGITVDNADVKEWELNEKFKESRNEADLTGKDIVNSAELWMLPGYKEASAEKRLAIAEEALKQKLVREHHGTMDISNNAAFDEFVKNQLAAPVSTGGQRSSGPDPRVMAEAKKERKRAQVDQILSMNAQPTQGPRYDVNLSNIYKNPYL